MRGGTDIGAAALGLLQQHCLPPSLKLYGGQWQVEGKVSLSRLAGQGRLLTSTYLPRLERDEATGREPAVR